MGKKVTKDATAKAAATSDSTIENSLKILSAKRQFVVSSISMGWQLAGVVIIPVIVGVKLDERFNSRPSYTLAALVIAVCGAIMVIKNTIDEVNKEQQEQQETDRKEKS
jgi:F0F1-type ATP synthase assembly protein I